MNKQLYRLVFNKSRGVVMVVAETGSRRTGNSTTNSDATSAVNSATNSVVNSVANSATIHSATIHSAENASAGSTLQFAKIAVFLSVLFGTFTQVNAQIIPAPGSSATSVPVLDTTANGVPLVQIVAPNGNGVSHNKYTALNVDKSGLIFNNVNAISGSALTTLGGVVDANPQLTSQSARVILNEVTGSGRSQLRGSAEIAGQRAELIIANPNGITCSGCGFINVSHGVLTTGKPEFGGEGSLDAFRVTRGDILLDKGSLNGAGIDQFDLLARHIRLNDAAWTRQMTLVAGANRVGYRQGDADLKVTPIDGEGNQPEVGIDVAALGGMYAGKITLISTDKGIGVANYGVLEAFSGAITMDSRGKVIHKGKSTAAEGMITVRSDDEVQNGGSLKAGNGLVVDAATVVNQGGGTMDSVRGLTRVMAKTGITNSGVMTGAEVAIGAVSVKNTVGPVHGGAGIIASRGGLDIGAISTLNENGGLIHADRKLSIGRTLDHQFHASGVADSILNTSARLTSGDEMQLLAANLSNKNNRFATENKVVSVTPIVEFQLDGQARRWDASLVKFARCGADKVSCLYLPDGTYGQNYTRYSFNRTVTRTEVTRSQPGEIRAGGDLITHGNVLNENSIIVADGRWKGDHAGVSNLKTDAYTRTVDEGTSQHFYTDWFGWLRQSRERRPDVKLVYKTTPEIQRLRLHQDESLAGSVNQGAHDEVVRGGYIQAKSMKLNVDGVLQNNGSLIAFDELTIVADTLKNRGEIQSDGKVGATLLLAKNDVVNQGGRITGHRVGVGAGRDIDMGSVVTDGVSDSAAQIDADALTMHADRDLILMHAAIDVKDNAVIEAGRDINLRAVTTTSVNSRFEDARNFLRQSEAQVHGTVLHAGGSMQLHAGQDISVDAGVVNAGGALTVLAERDIFLNPVHAVSAYEQVMQHDSSGWFSRVVSQSAMKQQKSIAVGSGLFGDSVIVRAKHDVDMRGSKVLGVGDVVVLAGNGIRESGAENGFSQNLKRTMTTSGIFVNDSGYGLTFGSKTGSTNNHEKMLIHNKSVIGSATGRVLIDAGNAFHQSGSDVVAKKGNADIFSRKISVVAEEDTVFSKEESRVDQAGLSLTFFNPVISVVRTAKEMNLAKDKTTNPAMQKLATTAVVASGIKAAIDAALVPKTMGGFSFGINIGGSSFSQSQEQQFSLAGASSIKAGGRVGLHAAGAGRESTIDVVGSNISAADDVVVTAEGKINFIAANNQYQTQLNRNALRALFGVSIMAGIARNGVGLEAAVSGINGSRHGDATTHVPTTVEAGKTLVVHSAHDVNLIGAVASGAKLDVAIEGNLSIVSLQDSSQYRSQEISGGANGILCLPPYCSGVSNFSADVGLLDSVESYRGVIQQSALKAGLGGLDVRVKGNTMLLGGGVFSGASQTDPLVVNRFATGSLMFANLQNDAVARASMVGAGFGADMAAQGVYGVVKAGISNVLNFKNQSGSSRTTTYSVLDSAVDLTLPLNRHDALLSTNDSGLKQVGNQSGLRSHDATTAHEIAIKQDVVLMESEVAAGKAIQKALFSQVAGITDKVYFATRASGVDKVDGFDKSGKSNQMDKGGAEKAAGATADQKITFNVKSDAVKQDALVLNSSLDSELSVKRAWVSEMMHFLEEIDQVDQNNTVDLTKV